MTFKKIVNEVTEMLENCKYIYIYMMYKFYIKYLYNTY